MNNARVTNAPGSGTTSPAARPPRAPNRELAYLTRQAADAKAALTQTAHALGQNLRQSATAHPVLAFGTAAVGGALLGRVLAGRAGHDGHATADSQPPAEPPSLISDLVSDAIKPLIPNLIAAVLALFQPRESADATHPPRSN